MPPVITGRVLGAERVVQRLQTSAPEKAIANLRSTTRRLGYQLERKVKFEKLAGQVLNKRTGRLVRSVNTRFSDTEFSSTASTGTSLSYGRAWELGFHGPVNVRAHLRRGGMVRAHVRQVNMEKRPFLKPLLEEMRLEIREAYQLAVRGL